MTFWTSGTLLLASVILFCLLQQGKPGKDLSECFTELKVNESVYADKSNNPAKLSGIDYTMKVQFGKETVDCGAYIKWLPTFSKPNITFPEKSVKAWINFDKNASPFYKYFAVLFWDAGTKGFPYPIALYIVVNIPLDVFIKGFYGQEGVGDVVRDYFIPLPLPGHRFIIQVHKQWQKIDNPKTSTYRFPFNETAFEYEEHKKGGGDLDFPLSATYIRFDIIPGFDNVYRTMEKSAIKCIKSLKEKMKHKNKAVNGEGCLNALNASFAELVMPKLDMPKLDTPKLGTPVKLV